MLKLKYFVSLLFSLSIFSISASAQVLNANWTSAGHVPVTSANYIATGTTVNLSLGFEPEVGTNLTVVNHTGLPFIQGRFSNLAQGQKVALVFGGIGYNYVANYYGGDGNDLVLQWANNRVVAWGDNWPGKVGDGTTTDRLVATNVLSSGVLKGKTILTVAVGGDQSLALCTDGTVAAWGENGSGQLGNNSTTDSNVPVPVIQSGVLAGKTVVAISAGSSFSLALCSDGTIAAWGAGASGQLGNNITANSSVPVLVSTSGALSGKTVVEVSAGGTHSLALCADGTLVAWGNNSEGQFGNGSTAGSPVPVIVPSAGALAGKVVSGISAGGYHSLAIADGQAVSWGSNNYSEGRLGIGSTIGNSLVPVAVVSTGILSGKTVTSVAAGSFHSMALCSDGTVTTWGGNGSGALGDNSSSTRTSPVGVFQSAAFSGKTVIGVVAGNSFSIAQFSDGTLAAWGSNDSGQLGNNSSTSAFAGVAVDSSVLPVGDKFMVASPGFDAGTSHSLAIVASPARPSTETLAATALSSSSATLNGLVNANFNSTSISFEYGLSTSYGTSVAATPSPISDSADTAVSANISGLVAGTTYQYRVVATNALGTTLGANMTFIAASNNANLSSLSLSTGSLSPSFSSAVTEYSASVSNTTESITVRPTLAATTATVRVNGNVVTSGSNSGSINLAVGANLITVVVTAQDNLTMRTYNITVTRLSANADLSSLVPSSGSLSPAFDAATTAYTATVPYSATSITVSPAVVDVTAAVRVNGTNVPSGLASNPINLSVGSNTITILVTAQNSSTKTYTLVVMRQPLVATFSSPGNIPVTVNGLNATGNTAVLGLGFAPQPGTNLTLINNTSQGLISGSFSNLTHGQLVSLFHGGVSYQFVANYYGGTGNDLVLHWANTRLFAWGSNGSGQLGNNSITDSPIPTPVNEEAPLVGKTIFDTASGSNHSIALTSDGRVASWGYNAFGQLGNGTFTDSSIPISVSGTALSGKTVIAIAAGQFHNLALCSDGTLVAWGYNFYGQLGNGTTSNSNAPVAVSRTGVLSGKTIISIAAGSYHSFALCSDGTLAAWGYNGNGELGNGGTGFSQLPVAVDTSGVLTGKTITSICAGSFHSFVLCSDSTLAGWGFNGNGQLGDNSTQSRRIPVLMDRSGVLSGKQITKVSAGYYHSVALNSDGSLAAWGNNANGELGDGTNVQRITPVAVVSDGALSGKTVVDLAAGAVHGLVTCSDGTISSWGYNGEGELGTGMPGSSNVPVVVNASALRIGEFYALGRSGATALHSLGIIASPPPAVVTALAATSITSTSAVLNGSINPNGSTTTASFDYGQTNLYGITVPGSPEQVSGNDPMPVSASITGLSPGTTYRFRLNGISSGGTVRSAEVVFTTAGFNANLSNLTLSAGSLTPAFSSTTTSYAASVPSTTSSIAVTPTVATPGSTVTVNGVPVLSGMASTPLFLFPGNNTLTIVVTAENGNTSRTYTVSLTRLSPAPEIGVSQSGIAISDGGSLNFGPATVGRPAVLTFVITNTGNSNLTGLGMTIDGPDASQFTVTTIPDAPVTGPTGSTTFAVTFTPVGAGPKSAAMHIASNDADENPYDIELTGTGLSSIADTDGDGLNDAAEFQMEALGFDWQVAQPTMVGIYFTNAEIGGLGDGNGLNLDAPKLTKNQATGLFTLRIGIEKSTDLRNYTPFPITAPQTRITGDGKLEFDFTSPDNAAFYRVFAN